MSKKRIILRADCGKKTGYGHFVRTLALANHLKDDFNCNFVSYNEENDFGLIPDSLLTQIYSVCKAIPVGGHSLDEFNKVFLSELDKDDIVVLDNYYFSTNYQKAIKDIGCKLVCIDDIPTRHMVCDVLICGSPQQRSNFSLEPYTEFISSIEWIFLRDEFLVPNKVRNIVSYIQEVVIAMGGSDAFNLTDKMIGIVRNCVPQANINVIAGPLVKINSNTTSVINVHRNLTAKEMVDIFDKSDIGIFPSSTVAIEAASRKLPIVGGYYAQNQMALYDYCVKNRIFAPLGNLQDSPDLIESRLCNILRSERSMPPVINFNKQKQNTVELFNRI